MKKRFKSIWTLQMLPSCALKSGATVRDTMLMSLMRMLSAGPDVSLNGSPTVSPTTHVS